MKRYTVMYGRRATKWVGRWSKAETVAVECEKPCGAETASECVVGYLRDVPLHPCACCGDAAIPPILAEPGDAYCAVCRAMAPGLPYTYPDPGEVTSGEAGEITAFGAAVDAYGCRIPRP